MSNMKALIRKWFPERVDPAVWKEPLAHFYATNQAYHAMTATSGKETHPQVQLLLSMAKEGGRYAEVGCGGGAVSRLLGRTAAVAGFDVSPVAIEKARAAVTDEQVVFSCAEGDKLPLETASMDGCYSFEVLEHIWDPEAVIREMARVVKPGGFILVSMPNWFSMDMHIKKRPVVRSVEWGLALIRCLLALASRRTYWNLKPDIEGDVYPDCDMVSTLNPLKIRPMLEGLGCGLEFIDSTYMCAHRVGVDTGLAFQKLTARPVVRHFGDHFLMLAVKRT